MSVASPYDPHDAKQRAKRVAECDHAKFSTTVYNGIRLCDGCGGFLGYDL